MGNSCIRLPVTGHTTCLRNCYWRRRRALTITGHTTSQQSVQIRMMPIGRPALASSTGQCLTGMFPCSSIISLSRRLYMPRISFKASFRYARLHYIGLLLVSSLSIWLIHIYLLHSPLSSFLWKSAQPYDLLFSSALPSPSAREGDDTLDSVDPRWRAFRPLPPPDPPFPRLQPTRFLPPICLEQWFEEGELHCGTQREEDKLDVVWLWVNGSDGRWTELMARYMAQEGIHSGALHFRCVWA